MESKRRKKDTGGAYYGVPSGKENKPPPPSNVVSKQQKEKPNQNQQNQEQEPFSPSVYVTNVPRQLYNASTKHRYTTLEMLGSVNFYHLFCLYRVS